LDRRRFIGALGTLALLSPAPSLAGNPASAGMSGCHMDTDANGTRLTIDLIGDVTYQVFTLRSPSRVVIDLDGVPADWPLQNIPLDGTPVAAIRSGRRGSGMRVLLDMHHDVHPQSTLHDGALTRQHQLIVQLPTTDAWVTASGAMHSRPVIIAIDPAMAARIPVRSAPVVTTKSKWPWPSQ
jgi:N-acetylmuramoyl-L-alanine amidase